MSESQIAEVIAKLTAPKYRRAEYVLNRKTSHFESVRTIITDQHKPGEIGRIEQLYNARFYRWC